MSHPSFPGNRELWLAQIFSSQAAQSGGVVRRRASEVERRIGRAQLELEVRRRGFHMFECAGQFVIVCTRGDVRLIC